MESYSPDGESASEMVDDAVAFVEDISSEVSALQDEAQANLDNMPEQLQSSGSGEVLQSRIDGCDLVMQDLDEAGSTLDSIDRGQALDEVESEIMSVFPVDLSPIEGE